jgi:hypothetical protein
MNPEYNGNSSGYTPATKVCFGDISEVAEAHAAGSGTVHYNLMSIPCQRIRKGGLSVGSYSW